MSNSDHQQFNQKLSSFGRKYLNVDSYKNSYITKTGVGREEYFK